MRNSTTFFLSLLFSFPAFAQTILFTERFDNGVMTFDLNATDVSSTANGYNKFVINDNYTGGSGTTTCLGFSVAFNVPSTASQPAGINGSPASKYLHTLSDIAENAGIYSCCFLAADGVCSNGENYFSKMNTDISTLGYTNVEFSFWWLCNGGTNNYGEVYYSVDGGSNWNLLGSPVAQYKNQSNWTQTTITNALFDNQASLRFGFRFVNQQTLTAADPGFGIDEIAIRGTASAQPTLTTGTVSGNPLCPGENITVDYTASSPFNTGNIFTAELSDASGNFLNPITIGSDTSSTSGSINASIPSSTPAGTGYRIRVLASNPAIVANDNGINLTVGTIPVATLGTLADVCGNDAPFSMYAGTPAGGDYFGTGISNNIFDPQLSGTGTFNIIYTFADFNGCSDSASNKITVNPAPVAGFSGLAPEYCNSDAPVNLTGSPSGGTFLGDGITGNVFYPADAGSGTISVHYVFINQQNCADTATQITAVNLCSGIGPHSNGEISFYPNPVRNELRVALPFSQLRVATVHIRNSLGQLVVSGNFSVKENTLAVPLKAICGTGVFYLAGMSGNKSFSGKFLKE